MQSFDPTACDVLSGSAAVALHSMLKRHSNKSAQTGILDGIRSQDSLQSPENFFAHSAWNSSIMLFSNSWPASWAKAGNLLPYPPCRMGPPAEEDHWPLGPITWTFAKDHFVGS